jgi:glutathione-regulated potassium-efflux system ancillary protein KefC/glutathione-regulated potassium-efflux system protein KefB
MLGQIALFLAAAVLIVPISRKLGLGTVIGYLVAGIVIGPWGLRLVTDVESILHFSEFGVVLLLFIIGLELQPSRLWALRHPVFGLGSAQMALPGLLLAAAAWLAGSGPLGSVVIGAGLAMSSTAFVLQTLAERSELTTRHGREALSILLFQDLAVIPLLALLPMVSGRGAERAVDWAGAGLGLLIIVLMVGLGRTLLRHLFRAVARFGSRELFTAAALLVVIGTALLMNHIGLSMALGAFIAGVLMADSEFRHEVEAELEPFKSLLLGLFFIAVGMSLNLGAVRAQAALLPALLAVMLVIKGLALYAISRLSGAGPDTARNLAVAMAGGGEFAFVLFTLARSHGLLEAHAFDLLMVLVTLSLISAPLLFLFNDRVLTPWLEHKAEPEYDRIDDPPSPVIIFGFGRVGQIISRILHMRGIPFTALESNPTQVDFVRRYGSKIYYGDATRLDLLRSARVETAKLCVLTINNIETSVRVAQMLRRHYPRIPIYARAHNRLHCYKLMDLGVQVLYRDTFYSSLKLARAILEGLGMPAPEAERTVEMFREHDEKLLLRQHAIYKDEQALIESVLKSRAELQSLFESDETERRGKGWAT